MCQNSVKTNSQGIGHPEDKYAIGQRLVCDILYLKDLDSHFPNKMMLVSVDTRTGYVLVADLPHKSTEAIKRILIGIYELYLKWGYKIKEIATDAENNFKGLKSPLCYYQIEVYQYTPYEKAKLAERYIRTINNKMGKIINELNYELPEELYPYLCKYVATCMNCTPNSKTPILDTWLLVELLM